MERVLVINTQVDWHALVDALNWYSTFLQERCDPDDDEQLAAIDGLLMQLTHVEE